ncbi:MAG: DUF5071 domain-containing protein [Lentisphaerae bacterium]|nr:DUF5071 domain-containing protein [Lentisphaerota bacterium]
MEVLANIMASEEDVYIVDRKRISRELKRLLPQDPNDTESIKQLRELGYPAIEPLLSHLIKWTRQPDWPIASPTIDLFVSLGPDAAQVVNRALHSSDRCLISQVVTKIVARWPKSAVELVSRALCRIMINFQLLGPDLEAAAILASHNLVEDVSWFLSTLAYDKQQAEARIAKIASIRSKISGGEPS